MTIWTSRLWTAKREWIAILAIAFIWLVVFRPALSGDHVFFYRDILHNYLPMKWLLVEAFRRGEIPWWNPHQFGGVPFAADLLSAVYYPLNVLLFLPSFYLGFNLFIAVHYLIAAFGVYFLTRNFGVTRPGALVAAISFAFGCLMVWTSNGVQWLSAYSWMPWTLGAFWLFLKLRFPGWLAIAASCLAMQLLAGDPQSAYVACAICLVMVILFRKELGKKSLGALAGLAFVVLLAWACTAVVLVPAFELARLADRSEFVDLASSMEWSFHPIRLIEMLFSFPFGNVYPESTFWGGFAVNGYPFPYNLSIYFGSVTAVFMGWGIVKSRGAYRWLPVTGLFVSLSAALGKFFFLQPLLYRFAPLWKLFRYPERLMVFFVLFACWLAGAGVSAYLNEKPRRSWIIYVSCVATLVAMVALVASFWPNQLHKLVIAATARPVKGEGISHLAESARTSLMFIGLLWLISISGRMEKSAVWLVPVLVACDVSIAAAQLVWVIPTDFVSKPPDIFTLADVGGRPRVYWNPNLIGARFSPRQGLPYQLQVRALQKAILKPNLGLLYGLDYWTAYSSAKLKSFEKIHSQLKLDDILNWWNVKLLVAPLDAEQRGFSLTSERKLIQQIGNTGVYSNGSGYPRDWIVHRTEVVSTEAEIAERLTRGPNLREVAFVLAPSGDVDSLQQAPSVREESIEVVRESNTVRYRLTLLTAGYLVSSDAFYPGWSATVDGKAQRLLPANLQMRTLFVEAGTHQIVMSYTPSHFAGAMVATILGWLVVASILMLGVMKNRRVGTGFAS